MVVSSPVLQRRNASSPAPVLHWPKLFDGCVWVNHRYGNGYGYGYVYGYGYGYGYGDVYGYGYGYGYGDGSGGSE